jgi:hypothetical protein
MAESCCRRRGGKFSLSAAVVCGADIIWVWAGCVWGGFWATANVGASSRRAIEVGKDRREHAKSRRRALVIGAGSVSEGMGRGKASLALANWEYELGSAERTAGACLHLSPTSEASEPHFVAAALFSISAMASAANFLIGNHWALSGNVSMAGSERATSANAGIMAGSP